MPNQKRNKDTTVLIDLLWFNVVHLFQYFFLIYYGPYSSWNILMFLVYLFVNFFENTIIMIMIMIEIQYYAYRIETMALRAPLTYIYCPKRRHFVASYVMQQYKSTTV